MTPLTIVSANVYTANRRRDECREVLEDLDADVIGAQEGWWLNSLLGFNRLRADYLGGRGAVEVPIFLARDLEYHGHGARYVHRDIPGSRVAKERWLSWCRFVKAGHRIALINGHINAALQQPDGDVYRADRVDLARRHMKAIVREVRRTKADGYLPFVTLDSNYRRRAGQDVDELWRWSPHVALDRVGLKWISHGLDGVAVPVELDVRASLRYPRDFVLPGSDHRGVRIDVDLPGGRDH